MLEQTDIIIIILIIDVHGKYHSHERIPNLAFVAFTFTVMLLKKHALIYFTH